MRYGENENLLVVLVIDEPVREAAQSAASDVFAEWMPRTRETADAIDRGQGFHEKRIAEARRLSVVVRDSLVQLLPCDLEEPDGHFTRYFASTSSSGTDLISPRR